MWSQMQTFTVMVAGILTIAVGKREMGVFEKFWKGNNNNKDKYLMSSYYVADLVVSTLHVYLV